MKKAIVLLNMGGPNNLAEVKLFLDNMFNDKRIITAPKPIRKIISWAIVKSRLKEATNNYRLLGGKSPIVGYTKELVSKVEQVTGIKTTFAMRYTPPFTQEALEEIKDADKIYAIPLYPHHSRTTTESSFDALHQSAKKLQITDKIVKVSHYHRDVHYNQTLIERIKEALSHENAQNYDLIFSAHGLPQKVIDQGDLYQQHIEENVAIVSEMLAQQNIDFQNIHLAYQSKVGPLQWTKPYLDEKLKSLKNKNVIICPIAFTIDNSETEFELEIEYREVAESLGFIHYKVAKAPNDHPLFVELIKSFVVQ
ncbi:MAG: ferrochelatase [Epsilonproteobacteria bacterium]|nr:ferrochelatase [Campylobacterota bacterium]